MARYQRQRFRHEEWEHITRREARALAIHYYMPEVLAAMLDSLDSGAIDVIDCKTYGKIRKRPDGRRKKGRGDE